MALARAILRDASVLLLDERTSGLDAASEQAVLDALDRAAEGRTVLSVSHRLSLAARADGVVVLDGGRVVEQGPPQELLAAGGAYARLRALQHPQEPARAADPGRGWAPPAPRTRGAHRGTRAVLELAPRPRAGPGLLAWALLGDGRRCETWLAWDVGRWCPVAVKLPRPGPAARAVDGLARPVGEAPAGRHRCGSPPWMAPERVRRQPASPGMDLFALGAVLFELATGTQAFDPADDGPPERRWPQLAGPPPLASSRNTEVPAAVDQAVAALLAPDPADRPASAGQALALLAEALPADAAEEDRLWPTWATERLAGWQASAMERPPLASRPA
jgi:hypothetical protein